MASDIEQFAKAVIRAQDTAAKVVPAAYTAIDVLFFKGDEFQNSAGLALEQAVTELDALNMSDLLKYSNSIKEAKIANLILSSENITDPMLKQVHQKQVNEEIKKTLELDKKVTEQLMGHLAKVKAEKANDKAVDREMAKANISIASYLVEESDSDKDRREEVANSLVQGPNDAIASA